MTTPAQPLNHLAAPSLATLFRGHLATLALRDANDSFAEVCGFRSGREYATVEALTADDDVAAWIAALPTLGAPCVRRAAIALRAHPDAAMIPAIDALFADFKAIPAARRNAIAEAFTEDLRWRGEAGRVALRRLLDHPSPVVASRAAVCLGVLDDQPSLRPICALHDRLWRRRQTRPDAIGALWALHDLGAVDALRARLRAGFDEGRGWPAFPALFAARGDVDDVPFLTARGASVVPDLAILFALTLIARRVGFPAFHDAVPDPVARFALTTWFAELPADDPQRFFSLRFRFIKRGRAARAWWPGLERGEPGIVAGAHGVVALW